MADVVGPSNLGEVTGRLARALQEEHGDVGKTLEAITPAGRVRASHRRVPDQPRHRPAARGFPGAGSMLSFQLFGTGGDLGALHLCSRQAQAVRVDAPLLSTARGVVRLLNTSGGRALCLAGAVDVAAVEAFVRRYGREPARVDVIDAGSVTSLSPSGLELVLDHLDVAERAGRRVALRPSAPVQRMLAAAGR